MAHNMKRNPAAGTGKVFWFSLRQMLFSKGWLGSTIGIALLLAVGIPLILLAMTAIADDDDTDDDETPIRTVYVVDETEGEADYNALKTEDEELTYTACASMDAAISESAGKNDAVILRVAKSAETYSLTVYLTQVTEITRSRASSLADDIRAGFSAVLMQKAELTPEGVMLLSMPVTSETAAVSADAEEDTDDQSVFAEILGAMVPFLMMMLMYMMIALYGQSMANSAMLEKTSKLMETILTAVHPFALMAGKLLATACAAVIQLLIWLAATIFGTVGGAAFAVKLIPETDSGAVTMINDAVGELGVISIPGVIVSLCFMALGFLLYLGLAGVSGALASKQEDLSKTNIVFTLMLVISMLLCLMNPEDAAATADAGGEFSLLSDALWLKLLPFTSILLMPGKLILGKAEVGETLASLGCLIAGVVLVIAAAAAIYRMLVLYRGAPPNPKALLAMLKENRKPKEKTEG